MLKIVEKPVDFQHDGYSLSMQTIQVSENTLQEIKGDEITIDLDLVQKLL